MERYSDSEKTRDNEITAEVESEKVSAIKHVDLEVMKIWQKTYLAGENGPWYRKFYSTDQLNTKAKSLLIGEAMRDKPREILSGLVQLRISNGRFDSCFQKFNIKGGPLGCGCGYDLETVEHIIKDCTKYSLQRE